MSRKPPKLLPTKPETLTRIRRLSGDALDPLRSLPGFDQFLNAGSRVFVEVPITHPLLPLTGEQQSAIVGAVPMLATVSWPIIEAARQRYACIKIAQAKGITRAAMKARLQEVTHLLRKAVEAMDLNDTVCNEAWRQFAAVQSDPPPEYLRLSAFDRDEIYPVLTWLVHRWNRAAEEMRENTENNTASPKHPLGATAFDLLCADLAAAADGLIKITAPRSQLMSRRPSDFQQFVWCVFATIPEAVAGIEIRDAIGGRAQVISPAFMGAVADWLTKRKRAAT